MENKENISIRIEKKIYDNGKIERKIVYSNNVKEVTYYYSTGELFFRKLVDNINEEEYIEYFSKKGDTITKLKNNYNSNYKIIFDINSGKYLKLIEKKLYYNRKIFFGRVRYYSGVFLIEESYNSEGELDGISKISHYEEGIISEINWKSGMIVLRNKDDKKI